MMGALRPDYITPADLAAHLGVSERTLREIARRIGACSQVGKRMILTAGDVQRIMEATRPCPSTSTSAARFGITEAPLTGGDYAVLHERLTAKPLKGSKRRSKGGRGNVISMARQPE